MCYVMHIGAVEALKLRATQYLIDKYLKKVQDGLIGTLSYSDPETGLALLVPDRLRRAPGRRRLRGAQEGVVDDVGRVRRLLRPADHVARLQRRLLQPVGVRRRTRTRSRPSRRSGTRWACAATSRARCCCDWKFVPERAARRPDRRRRVLERRGGRPVLPDRLVGRAGTASRSARSTSPCRHTTRKTHKDVGLRVCDYPTIQDAVGEAIMDTNASAHDLVRQRGHATRPGHGRRAEEPDHERARARQLPALAVADQVRRGQERRPRRRQDAALLRRHRATRSSRCSSSATCATARPAGSWARPTRCCGSSSARRPCSAWTRSTTGTRSSTSARSTTS